MPIPDDLTRAISVVEGLNKRLPVSAHEEGILVAHLEWSGNTLAVMIGNWCLWEDQNSDWDDLTVEGCLEAFNTHILAPGKQLVDGPI